ncbi:MAG: bile acid:sodium symporter [Proteobacteria bacterium]|nr:bile acid:sodium symporter [Pseudomonadota bacterium]MBU4074459.1 bile acid:sodium symporter [Pseudomonadota bacterium]MBU4121927.1 bile acid:sodium symporter [Pseudomonadota bacterium]
MFAIQDFILFCVVFASFVAGILLPRFGTLFQPFILIFLMAILFLSFLTIRQEDIRRLFRDQGRAVLWLSFLKLIAFPIGVYLLFRIFLPSYAPAALLLAGVSTGVIAPFISTLVSANAPLVLVIVVITSILLPFTLPLLVKLLLGQTMEISLLVMIRMLALVIFIPVAAVLAVQRFIPEVVRPILKARYVISLMIFAGINMGVFSQYSDFFYRNPGTILEATGVSILLGGIFLVLGFFALGKASVEDRLAAAISMMNINNVLVLVFAARFFGPLESTVAAMYLIPFYGLIVPMRIFQYRLRNRGAPGDPPHRGPGPGRERKRLGIRLMPSQSRSNAT